MNKIIAAICLLVCFVFSNLHSQSDVSQQQAEKLVMQALEYVKKADWESYAKILDPEDTRLLKETFNGIVQQDSSEDMIKVFEGINSREDFINLSPVQFFPYFMRYIITIQAGLGTALSTIEGKVLGSVKENNLVHVLTRQSSNYGAKQFGQVEVITVINKNNGIFIKMKEDIRAFAERLRTY